MSVWRLEVGLLVFTVALSAVGARRWYNALPPSAAHAPPVGAAPIIPAPPNEDSLDTALQLATETDPFRLSRLPATVPFARMASQLAVSAAPPAFRPTLVLKGIVGGPPWQAVIDGIPGEPPGTVVKAGSTFDKLHVRSVTRDTVLIQGPDSTWRLTLTKGST